MNDISLNSFTNWTPIGNYSGSSSLRIFRGTFIGNGKVVQNLTITGTEDYRGLFGVIDDASIHELGLENCNVSGGNYVGSLVGKTTNYSSVQRCYATGNVIATGCKVGGLVGSLDILASIKWCVAANNMVSTASTYTTGCINRVVGYYNVSNTVIGYNYALNTMVVQNSNGTVNIEDALHDAAGMGKPISDLQSSSFYATAANWGGLFHGVLAIQTEYGKFAMAKICFLFCDGKT